MIWRMKFRYHETGSYFVTMTFADIMEANRYIKQEETREQSEFLDFKILEHYGIN
jgi:hypothetical protein